MVLETAKCLTPPALEASADDSKRYARVYLGSETCEWLLPNVEEIERALQTWRGVTILTPPVTKLGLARIQRILARFASHPTPLEVVANDFGVLELLRSKASFTPVVGRILSKNFLDVSHGDTMGVTTGKALDFIRTRYRVTRLEWTNYPRKLTFPGDDVLAPFSLSMYYPWQNLTTSRQCVFRFHGVSPTSRVDRIGCERRCVGRAFRLRYPGMVEEALLLKGNTVYSDTGKIPYTAGELKRLGVDRLVVATPNDSAKASRNA